jgi:hydrogenase expression/formation protein HypE
MTSISAGYEGPACPIPINDYPTVTLGHGGGGRLTQMLVESMFLPAFDNPALSPLLDGAILTLNGIRLSFSTDTFTVSPLFFPGGDIGSLAVHGTVNDVAMCGGRPLALSAGFVVEEGLPMEDLWRIVQSMRDAAQAVGVPIVTGDTKVVERGKGDGLFINTAGIGLIGDRVNLSPQRVQVGDVVLINGGIAEHGMAIMSMREGLEFESTIASDSASLVDLVLRLLEGMPEHIHVLRDPTRGGVASSLNEIAAQARLGIRLDESAIPIGEEVRGACEILGLDPLYVANEGKCLCIVAREAAEEVLTRLRTHPLGKHAAVIGEIVDEYPGRVMLRSRIGGLRVVDMMSGEQLPRIC